MTLLLMILLILAIYLLVMSTIHGKYFTVGLAYLIYSTAVIFLSTTYYTAIVFLKLHIGTANIQVGNIQYCSKQSAEYAFSQHNKRKK